MQALKTIPVFSALIIPILFFALVLTTTQGLAQTTFTLDSTNCSFLSVATDTSTGMVTIQVKTKDRPGKEILEYKNCILSYSLKATNVEVDNHDGMGNHPAKHISTTSKEMPIIKITSDGKNTFIVKVQLKAFQEIKMFGWLPDEKTLGFKMERLEMK